MWGFFLKLFFFLHKQNWRWCFCKWTLQIHSLCTHHSKNETELEQIVTSSLNVKSAKAAHNRDAAITDLSWMWKWPRGQRTHVYPKNRAYNITGSDSLDSVQRCFVSNSETPEIWTHWVTHCGLLICFEQFLDGGRRHNGLSYVWLQLEKQHLSLVRLTVLVCFRQWHFFIHSKSAETTSDGSRPACCIRRHYKGTEDEIQHIQQLVAFIWSILHNAALDIKCARPFMTPE